MLSCSGLTVNLANAATAAVAVRSRNWTGRSPINRLQTPNGVPAARDTRLNDTVRLHVLLIVGSSLVVCEWQAKGGSGLPPGNNVDYVGEYAEPHAQTPKGS